MMKILPMMVMREILLMMTVLVKKDTPLLQYLTILVRSGATRWGWLRGSERVYRHYINDRH
jgi:hypothetical protein